MRGTRTQRVRGWAFLVFALYPPTPLSDVHFSFFHNHPQIQRGLGRLKAFI
jgi:hypothetical protein